jgi:hypothetical protein
VYQADGSGINEIGFALLWRNEFMPASEEIYGKVMQVLVDEMDSKKGSALPCRGMLVGLAFGLVFVSGCGSQPVGKTEPPTVAPGVPQPKAAAAPGPAVGVRAPGFVLKDQTGAERSLDEFRKRGPVALVFYRSAKW